MKRLIFLFLSILALSLSNCEKPDDPDEITDFAYPPAEMLRYFDFPEGSWWAYRCLNDSTIDTLTVLESEDAARVCKTTMFDNHVKSYMFGCC